MARPKKADLPRAPLVVIREMQRKQKAGQGICPLLLDELKDAQTAQQRDFFQRNTEKMLDTMGKYQSMVLTYQNTILDLRETIVDLRDRVGSLEARLCGAKSSTSKPSPAQPSPSAYAGNLTLLRGGLDGAPVASPAGSPSFDLVGAIRKMMPERAASWPPSEDCPERGTGG